MSCGPRPSRLPRASAIASLRLDGSETFDISGLDAEFAVQATARCTIVRSDGTRTEIPLTIRLDTPDDISYWRHGGILPFVWREYMNNDSSPMVTA